MIFVDRQKMEPPNPTVPKGAERTPRVALTRVLLSQRGGRWYYSPHLVRKGLLAVSQVQQNGWLHDDVSLPPTWKPVSAKGFAYVSAAPLQDLPTVWRTPPHKMLAARVATMKARIGGREGGGGGAVG